MNIGISGGIAITVLAAFLPAALGQPSYTVTEIATLGGPSSRAVALNNTGTVVGFSSTRAAPDVSRAFRWSHGEISDLGTLGGPSAAAFDVNDAGQVTGWAETKDSIPFNETVHAYLWQGGTMVDLGTTGGMSSRGLALNAEGVVTGASQICWYDPKDPKAPCFPVANEYTFVSDGGAANDLGGLFGSSDSSGLGINASGQIVGQSIALDGFLTARHAVLWQDGQAIDLGTLGGVNSWAFDVNDAGIVAGFSDSRDNVAHHPFVYDIEADRMTDLGLPSGFLSAEALAINNSGQIVGVAFSCCGVSAFVYDGFAMHDLNELIAPGSGWTLIEATDINDIGWIVGYGLHNGAERGFLLKPVTDDCGADLDCDNEVDLFDYALFVACLTGPQAAMLPGCDHADLELDGDVDLRDLGLFVRSFAGNP